MKALEIKLELAVSILEKQERLLTAYRERKSSNYINYLKKEIDLLERVSNAIPVGLGLWKKFENEAVVLLAKDPSLSSLMIKIGSGGCPALINSDECDVRDLFIRN